MIDLARTRTSMLSEIGALDEEAIPHLTDAADPQFAALDRAKLSMQGLSPDDLLPPLGRALSQRFKHVPPDELRRGLLQVLKKAVGNAYKWGNRQDPDKRISVDVVATRNGAVVSISNEGEGFDVADLLKRFENDEDYATHGGSGFAIFEKSKSAIGYADGGHAVHIEFRCLRNGESDTPGFAQALDESFMLDRLRERPELCAKGESLVGCNISVSSSSKGRYPEIGYDLEFQTGDSERRRNLNLTGTLLRDRAAEPYANLLRGLDAACAKGVVRTVGPVVALLDPPLVLFELDSMGALDDWFKRHSSLDGFAEQVRGVAHCLRAVHECDVLVDAVEPDEEARRLSAMADRIVEVLTSTSPQRAQRARTLRDALLERWERIQETQARPIHGSFSWNSIAWTKDGLFLRGFEDLRCSHPGLDLGGFLADHLRFFVMRKKGDAAHHQRGREAFLEAYFGCDSPAWREDLPVFCCAALLQRTERLLGRKQKKWEPKIDPLLEACEQSLASF